VLSERPLAGELGLGLFMCARAVLSAPMGGEPSGILWPSPQHPVTCCYLRTSRGDSPAGNDLYWDGRKRRSEPSPPIWAPFGRPWDHPAGRQGRLVSTQRVEVRRLRDYVF